MDFIITFFRDILSGPLYIIVSIISGILICSCIGYLLEQSINKKNNIQKENKESANTNKQQNVNNSSNVSESLKKKEELPNVSSNIMNNDIRIQPNYSNQVSSFVNNGVVSNQIQQPIPVISNQIQQSIPEISSQNQPIQTNADISSNVNSIQNTGR